MGGVTSLDHPRAGLPLLEPSGGVNSVFASSSGGRPGRPEWSVMVKERSKCGQWSELLVSEMSWEGTQTNKKK